MEGAGLGAKGGKREFVVWEPKQHTEREKQDLRNAVLGPKGYKERTKRKLDEMEAQHQADQEEQVNRMDDGQAEQEEQAQLPSSKRQKGEGGLKVIPVSGRTWKLAGQRAATIMKPPSNKSWEKKMEATAARKNLLEQKRAAEDASKAKRKALALQRKASAERKAANRAKSEVVQKITNNATLKKMMKNKKQKKALRKADTN